MNYKGQLEGFPSEIVGDMIYYQVIQGFPLDVTVFEQYRAADINRKGFRWNATPEGQQFWKEVITQKNFDLFFERYPKGQETKQTKIK